MTRAVPTVRFLDHTADLGIEVQGASLEAVIEGAAAGMTRILFGDVLPDPDETRTFQASGEDPPLLLRNVLRELLFLDAGGGFATARLRVDGLSHDADTLTARCIVEGTQRAPDPRTELKGVTLHGLVAEHEPGSGWRARVIFDV